MTTEQESANRIAGLEKSIRQGETKWVKLWAKWKWWHSPNMAERYFGNVANEFACVSGQLPRFPSCQNAPVAV
jgi:hypothetical protein